VKYINSNVLLLSLDRAGQGIKRSHQSTRKTNFIFFCFFLECDINCEMKLKDAVVRVLDE